MRAAALALSTLLLAGCSTADATQTPPDPNFTCRFTHTSTSARQLRDLPAPVKAYIKSTVGGIADRGAFFNAGDAVTRPAPFNRYIRGGRLGPAYYLWYEHGGFAYWHQIVLIDHAGKAIAEAHGASREPGLCAQTDALLTANTH